jgi:thiosulfate reductase cytochrome b subunit
VRARAADERAAIFNAHPALYWGDISTFDDPIVAMRGVQRSTGEKVGITEVFDWEFETTGFLGLSAGRGGEPTARGFPSWATMPSYQDLALGRQLHFFFAWLFVINGLVYLGYSLATGHWRQLAPSVAQLKHRRRLAGIPAAAFPPGRRGKVL